MKDRVPLYPGRVTLTPVSGQANTFDLVRADQPTQEGTPLNKASLLKDATAALYGLPNTAVPDDALNELGVFKRDLANYYVWDKQKITKVISNGSLISTAGTVILWNNSGTIAQYSSSAIIQNNEIVLEDPITVSFAQLKALGNNIRGKYFINTNDPSAGVKVNALVYIPNDATIGGGENVVTTNKYYYPSIVENVEHTAYILTQNSVAPVEEGYTYENMGQLGAKVQIATGSYAGTGTAGSAYPSTLTFDFEPKIVFITATNTSNNSREQAMFLKGFNTYFYLMANGTSGSTSADVSVGVYSEIENNMLNWYSNNPVQQFNTNGIEYNYLAIG